MKVLILLSHCLTAPPRGGLTEMEHLASSCSHIRQQQMGLTTLEQQDYDMDPFRQGLTPPQMPGDHMHPYGNCCTFLLFSVLVSNYNLFILLTFQKHCM